MIARLCGRRSVTVALLVLLLTACARIPTESEIIAGPDDSNRAPGLQAILPGPADGATPFQIVEGFLKAGIAPQNDYSVARSYLTKRLARSWQPERQTVVHRDSATIKMIAPEGPGSLPSPGNSANQVPDPDQSTSTASVSVVTVDTIDSAGRLRRTDGGSTTITLRLAKVDGQWRVSLAPNLTMVAQNELDFVFRDYPVYFLDPTKAFLVPDPHWLPNDDSAQLATRLVATLEQGPPAWLQPAVVTAFPADAKLAHPAVTLEGRVATINFTRSAKNASDQELGLLHDQLRSTLETVPGIEEVVLRADGDRLDAPDGGLHTAPARSTAYAIHAGRVSALAGSGSFSPVTDLPSVRGMAAVGLAVDYTSPRFALLLRNSTQLYIVQPGDELDQPVLEGVDLVSPSFDWRGWLWAPLPDSDGTLIVISPKGEQHSVSAQWLAGRRINGIRVAPDGCRVAIASTDSSGTGHLELASISRHQDGQPEALRLGERDPFGLGPAEIRTMTWVDQLHLVALAKRPGDLGPQLFQLQVGGPVGPPLDSLHDVKVLTAGDGLTTLRARDGSNTIHAQALDRWVQVPHTQGTLALAYPG